MRELDLVKNYTGHEYDAVLDQFYAKYRMYDASDRRFTTIDPIRDGTNWYIYVENNPVMWVDPLGLAIASTDVHVYNGEDDAAVTMFVFVYDSAGVARPIANHKTIDGELMVSLNEIYTYLTEDITGHKSDKTATLNRTVNSRSLTYELNINGYYAKFVCDGKFDVKTTTATKSKNNDIQVSYKVDSGDVLVNLNDFLSVYGRGKNAATLNLYPYKVYYVSSHTTEHSQYTELVSGLELLDGYEKAKLKYPALDADLWLTQAKAAQHDVDFVESPAVLWNSLEDVATQLMAANAIGKLLTPDYNLPGKGVPEVYDINGKYTVAREVEHALNRYVPRQYHSQVIDAFGSDIRVTTLTEDTVVYRYYGGDSKASSYWYTPNKTPNPKSDLALPSGNTAEYVDIVVLPKGTVVLEGTVAPNFGQTGGGYQYYVPNP